MHISLISGGYLPVPMAPICRADIFQSTMSDNPSVFPGFLCTYSSTGGVTVDCVD
jgi:hypothetical protein